MTELSDLTELFRKFGLSTLIVILVTIILGSLFFVSPTIASKEVMNVQPGLIEQNASFWNVHLYAIPGSDATTLNVAVENVGNSCQGDVEFVAQYQGSSPTPVKGLEDPGNDRYVAVIPDFFPGCSSQFCTAIESGTLKVTCDQPELASRTVNFRRYYAPSGLEETIISTDNSAQLDTFATSLSAGHYVIVMPTNAAPGTPPSGVTLISESYTFRPSGLLNFSDENMSVSLDYRAESLGGANPLTVRMYEWDLVGREWLDVGEQTNFITGGPRISKPSKNFTTYVLGTGPLWCDGFNENIGLELDSLDNVIRLLADSGKLKLDNTTLPGSAVSQPYTPSMMIDAWKTISYTANITAGSQLMVSVLSADKTILIPDIESGGSLAAINPTDHPSLRLQVEMSTTSGNSPELFDWCILAKSKLSNVYLPVILR
jgi:hypothetical protein